MMWSMLQWFYRIYNAFSLADLFRQHHEWKEVGHTKGIKIPL